MAWDGNGSFSRVHDWTTDAGSAVAIEASRMDAEDDNFQAGIEACLAKNGENAATANLPMGGFIHTGVGNANARTTYASAADVMDQDLIYYVDSGAADAYVITPSPAYTAYEEGMRIVFRATNTNTGASTMNVNSLGAIAIQNADATALSAGEIVSGGIYELTYDANTTPDRWVLTSPSSLIPATMLPTTVEAIAGLATDDGNIIVGNGSTWVAESGSTARASLGANNAANLTTGELPDARLSSNVPLINAQNVFTGNVQQITGTAPQWRMVETGVTADNTSWSMVADAEIFSLRAWNDAFSSSQQFMTVQRTGNTIDSINFTATDVTFNGADLPVTMGGTGASSAPAARTNLGLVIGTNVQAWDANLDELALIGSPAGADEFIVSTGAGSWNRSSGASARASLGLTIGTHVQAENAHLTDLAALGAAGSADLFMVSSAAGTWAYETAAQVRTTLSLVPGTNVQTENAHLTDLAALGAVSAADNIMVSTAAGTWAYESGATARTSLGLGTGDSPQFTAVNIGAATDTTVSRAAAGVIAVEGKAAFVHNASTATYASAQIFFSTSAPTTEGNNGDIYFEYTV